MPAIWTRQRLSHLTGFSYQHVQRLDDLGILQSYTVKAPHHGGGRGGVLRLYPAGEALNALIVAHLKRAGIPLGRTREAIAWLRDNLDLERPLKEAVFLVDVDSGFYAIAYTTEELGNVTRDLAQKQGRLSLVAITLGELWDRVKVQEREMQTGAGQPAYSG